MTEYELIIFSRHHISSTNDILDQMWNEGAFGIHFGETDSFDPEEYTDRSEEDKKSLKEYFDLMDEITEKGAMVAADYRNDANEDEEKDKHLLVGIVEKGTKKEIKTYEDTETGKKFVYKIMKMTNYKKIPFEKYPELRKQQPPHKSMCRWRKMNKKILPFIYEREE
jgi:hypothetical protein